MGSPYWVVNQVTSHTHLRGPNAIENTKKAKCLNV